MAEFRQCDEWSDQLLDQTFSEEIADHIKNDVYFEASDDYWDKPWWIPTASRKFTVSSAWNIVRHKANPYPEFKHMWI